MDRKSQAEASVNNIMVRPIQQQPLVVYPSANFVKAHVIEIALQVDPLEGALGPHQNQRKENYRRYLN
jgi:hypothetical protein